jgi:hypothetical protein
VLAPVNARPRISDDFAEDARPASQIAAPSDRVGRESAAVRLHASASAVQTAPADMHPLAFTDRHGTAHLPLEALAAIAKAFAAAEPQTVIGYLEDEEEELRLRGNQPGDRWYHQYRRELSPGYALARQWAGLQQEAEMLRKEIARLRTLISSAAYDLKAAGQEDKSRRLLRAVEGG